MSLSLTLLLAACGSDDPVVASASADVKPVVTTEPLKPTSVEGRWRFQWIKAGATYQIWEIQPSKVREIGVCRSGWSSRTAGISALATVNSSEIKILEDIDVPPSADCYAGLRTGNWTYRITDSKLILEDAADVSRRFEGTYLGPLVSP